MKPRGLDSGHQPARKHSPRKSARVTISAEVQLRRRGHHNYCVSIFDLSPEGCRVDPLEKPQLDEELCVKFDGLEALVATVCWIEGNTAGVEFQRPIHPAVVDLIVKRTKPD
jgi:hypothetical protein